MLLKNIFQFPHLLNKTKFPLITYTSLQLSTSSLFSTNNKFATQLQEIQNKGVQIDIPEGSAFHEVINNVGMNKFINKVYKTSGISVAGALTVSQLALITQLSPMWSLCGIVGTLVGFIGAGRMSPHIYTELYQGYQVLDSTNSPLRLGLYGMGVVGLGLSSAPLFGYVNLINPAILPLSIGISVSIFASASFYAYMRQPNQLLTWQKSLMSGLYGIIGLNIAGLASSLMFGPNVFASCCFRLETFAGVGLFSALVAYDTHQAILAYREGYADHLGVSIDFVLDFWNILIRVVQIMSMFINKD